MKETTLFSIIAVLLVAILGIGAYAAFKNPSTVTALPATAVSTVTSAVSDIGNDQGGTPPAVPTSDTAAQGSSSNAGTYTMAQIAQHNSASSCYTAIGGSAYDLTSFIHQHPGGSAAILSLCGVDGTAAFEAQHGGQGRPEAELASLRIGTIAQ